MACCFLCDSLPRNFLSSIYPESKLQHRSVSIGSNVSDSRPLGRQIPTPPRLSRSAKRSQSEAKPINFSERSWRIPRYCLCEHWPHRNYDGITTVILRTRRKIGIGQSSIVTTLWKHALPAWPVASPLGRLGSLAVIAASRLPPQALHPAGKGKLGSVKDS